MLRPRWYKVIHDLFGNKTRTLLVVYSLTILFNLAVGGNFPGSPNGSTPFPATMEVDWVRVYSGEEPPAPLICLTATAKPI